MINIGFDFDNTIISYENSFYSLACQFYKIPPEIKKDKASVREFFINSDREKEFTELQGMVYGKEIMKAKITKNFKNFLKKIYKDKKFNIFIVSHKTKYPYVGEKINLRDAANNWITKNLTFNETELIKQNNIFYENTIEEKIERIKKINCHYFFDDLLKIIKLLPKDIDGFLYDPVNKYDKEDIKRIKDWDKVNISQLK